MTPCRVTGWAVSEAMPNKLIFMCKICFFFFTTCWTDPLTYQLGNSAGLKKVNKKSLRRSRVISFPAHGSTASFLRVQGGVTRSSVNPETSPYAAMHHFTSNNHSYSKPLIQLALSSCLWQQLSHPAIQRNAAGVEKPSGVRYPPPAPPSLHLLLHDCPWWQWQKSVIATSSDGFIKTSIVFAAERRRMGKERSASWGEERAHNAITASPWQVGPPILCVDGALMHVGEPRRARIIFHPLPLSLVGNDWIILQMNRSICLAHKHFLTILIKTIKAEQSERIKKTIRLD